MENGATQTIATFNGKLLLRKRVPGKPIAQLIFREAGKDWLCLSSNLTRVAQLQIGKDYKIEGAFKSLGEHAYIHEPQIAPLARQIVKRRVGISLAIALAILLTAGGIVLAATHKAAPSSPAATPQTARNDTPAATSDDTYAGTATTTPTDTPAADTPSATTPPTTAPQTPPPGQSNTPVGTPPVVVPDTPPTTPANLAASAASTSEVDITWQASTDDGTVTGYQIYRNGLLIDTIGANTAYIDTGVVAATDYTYTVVALDGTGNSSAHSAPANVTTPPDPGA